MTSGKVPPAKRSATALGLLRGVAEGTLLLQRCAECGTVPYPPREACPACLGCRLPWSRVADGGRVLAGTMIRTSTEEFFAARLPWHVGLVRADCGPSIMVHLPEEPGADELVRIEPRVDPGGRPVLVATTGEPPAGDPLTEFVLPAEGSRVRVTDPDSELGRAVTAALRGRAIEVVTSDEAVAVLDTRP